MARLQLFLDRRPIETDNENSERGRWWRGSNCAAPAIPSYKMAKDRERRPFEVEAARRAIVVAGFGAGRRAGARFRRRRQRRRRGVGESGPNDGRTWSGRTDDGIGAVGRGGRTQADRVSPRHTRMARGAARNCSADTTPKGQSMVVWAPAGPCRAATGFRDRRRNGFQGVLRAGRAARSFIATRYLPRAV